MVHNEPRSVVAHDLPACSLAGALVRRASPQGAQEQEGFVGELVLVVTRWREVVEMGGEISAVMQGEVGGPFIGLGWEVRRSDAVNGRRQSGTSMPSKFQFQDVMEGGGCVGYGRGRGKLGWHLSWHGSGGWMVQWRRRLPEEEDK
jgi:hypothetical protein